MKKFVVELREGSQNGRLTDQVIVYAINEGEAITKAQEMYEVAADIVFAASRIEEPIR